jgi:hypothetical protein
LFASIPLIFGVQQIAEGILWLTLPNSEYLTIQKIFTYVYLFFAQIVWPIWVPIAILLLEKEATRKNIQKVFTLDTNLFLIPKKQWTLPIFLATIIC